MLFAALAIAAAPAPAASMPAVVDHSKMAMGTKIPVSKLPKGFKGYTTQRVRPITSHPAEDWVASDIGAFRLNCLFAKMNYDDPIVFPGQVGAAHGHTYFGNVNVNAKSTDKTLGQGPSTCEGGTLNRTAYWVPMMLDGLVPIAPYANEVYYKDAYALDISKAVEPVPIGLKMISGNAKNTDPNNTGAGYACLSPTSNTPWYPTLTAAAADPICQQGFELIMSVTFPNCWDGVNLDSPNHASHMARFEQYRDTDTDPWSYPWRCPADHPHVLPSISYNIHYKITDPLMVSRLHLSSDFDPTAPAGITGHGDYWMKWDKKTMDKIVENCLRNNRDGHTNLLCDGTTLY